MVVPLGLLAAAGNDAVNLYIASYVCFESIERDGETEQRRAEGLFSGSVPKLHTFGNKDHALKTSHFRINIFKHT